MVLVAAQNEICMKKINKYSTLPFCPVDLRFHIYCSVCHLHPYSIIVPLEQQCQAQVLLEVKWDSNVMPQH